MTTTSEPPGVGRGPSDLPGDETEHDRLYRRRWWTLGVLCLSLLIVFVGNSSLNVAIPTLSPRAQAQRTSQLQWVIAVVLARVRRAVVLDRRHR